MLLETLYQAHQRELDVRATDIAYRQEWEQLQAVDRLERQLRKAASRLHFRPASTHA